MPWEMNPLVWLTPGRLPQDSGIDKYSVEVGGGKNHRYNLSDMVMLKDNHIGVAGGIRQAVEKTRAKISFSKKIELEVESLDQVKEALNVGCDIIMLDNMSIDQIREAVDLIAGRALIEVSGNISPENIGDYRGLGIDIISCGALYSFGKGPGY